MVSGLIPRPSVGMYSRDWRWTESLLCNDVLAVSLRWAVTGRGCWSGGAWQLAAVVIAAVVHWHHLGAVVDELLKVWLIFHLYGAPGLCKRCHGFTMMTLRANLVIYSMFCSWAWKNFFCQRRGLFTEFCVYVCRICGLVATFWAYIVVHEYAYGW